MDNTKETIGSARHTPRHDAEHINLSTEKAAIDHDFIDYAVNQLREMQFPAFKQGIIDYVKKINAHPDVIALFDSLNGYIEFRDQYHVQKSLQENSILKKKEYQITDETRENPDMRTRPTTANASIVNHEATNKMEERKDYPEVPPTAMSNFICDRCGKPFQNQQDLAQHRQFESGSAVT